MNERVKSHDLLALGFSSVGHFLFHYFAAMYFTIVLALAKDWQQVSLRGPDRAVDAGIDPAGAAGAAGGPAR